MALKTIILSGSLQDTFIIYSSISHQHMFRKDFAQNNNLENRKSENRKIPKSRSRLLRYKGVLQVQYAECNTCSARSTLVGVFGTQSSDHSGYLEYNSRSTRKQSTRSSVFAILYSEHVEYPEHSGCTTRGTRSTRCSEYMEGATPGVAHVH